MGTLTQLANGVRLAGGDIDEYNSGVRMYSRTIVPKPFKIRLKFTRRFIPTSTTNEGAFNLLGWVVATGSAPTSIPANWPANTTTRDVEVQDFLRGFRFSPGNINTTGTAESNRFRMQTYNGDGTRTQYNTNTTIVNLGLNVENELELSVTGSSATLSAVNLGLSVTYSAPLIGGMATGYLMFYTGFGMDAEWSDFRRIS